MCHCVFVNVVNSKFIKGEWGVLEERGLINGPDGGIFFFFSFLFAKLEFSIKRLLD